MGFLYGLLKFVVAFVAIASTLLLVMSSIKALTNPDFVTTERGVIEKDTNARIWYGLVASIFWALVIVLC